MRPSDFCLVAAPWRWAMEEREMGERLVRQQPLLSGNLSRRYIQLKKQAKKTKAGAELQSEINTCLESKDCSKRQRNSRLNSLSYKVSFDLLNIRQASGTNLPPFNESSF